jgi:hypothetical protein
VVHALVRAHPDFDKSDQAKVEHCHADVAERLLAMLCIKNADMTRFGSFVEQL